jgi:gamma-glutamyltranspeptidase / glutathione hydrolase
LRSGFFTPPGAGGGTKKAETLHFRSVQLVRYHGTDRNLISKLFLLIVICVPLPAQERWQARSMVISSRGIAATSQTLASQAGAQILARGGSAVDAAIAANAVLSVVEPMMCGIGGDLFAIYYQAKTGTLTGINASGWAGKGQTLEAYKGKGLYGIPSTGIHTATVPGAVDGWWQMHKKFGKLPWADLFQPAIYYARNGFPVTEIIQEDWAGTVAKLRADDNARKYWLVEGRAPKVGELFKVPALGDALELIAKGGRTAFYNGPIAQSILKTSKRLSGTLEAADLSEFTSEWIAPISIDYRGWTVYEMPPNGQGIAALMMLNLMERFGLPGMEQRSAEAMHVKIEAQKLAYRDVHSFVADPRHAKVPVAGMLSKQYAAERAKGISADRANCDTKPGEPEKGHTVYLSVIDKDGNTLSWIQSVSDMWGSGVAVDDYAFHLHDRGGNFSSDPGHPNALAGRKRPFHTIIPGFMEKGPVKIAFGIMRGGNQAQAHAQFVSNVVDHNMNIQAALEAPRFTRRSVEGCGVMMEGRLDEAAKEKLKTLGHYVDWRADYSGQMGGGQAVLLDSDAHMHYGASSPRKDGAAIPEPDPYFINLGKRP